MSEIIKQSIITKFTNETAIVYDLGSMNGIQFVIHAGTIWHFDPNKNIYYANCGHFTIKVSPWASVIKKLTKVD